MQAWRRPGYPDGPQVPHAAQGIFGESPFHKKSLQEEGVQERGPKSKRSQARGAWRQVKGMESRLRGSSSGALGIQR